MKAGTVFPLVRERRRKGKVVTLPGSRPLLPPYSESLDPLETRRWFVRSGRVTQSDPKVEFPSEILFRNTPYSPVVPVSLSLLFFGKDQHVGSCLGMSEDSSRPSLDPDSLSPDHPKKGGRAVTSLTPGPFSSLNGFQLVDHLLSRT